MKIEALEWEVRENSAEKNVRIQTLEREMRQNSAEKNDKIDKLLNQVNELEKKVKAGEQKQQKIQKK